MTATEILADLQNDLANGLALELEQLEGTYLQPLLAADPGLWLQVAQVRGHLAQALQGLQALGENHSQPVSLPVPGW